MIRIRQSLRSIINARYSVSSWLWIIVSTVSAVILLVMIVQGRDTPEVMAFLAQLPINGYTWTAGLILTGITKMYGMAFHKDRAVSVGSFVAFCLWVFGLLTFIFLGQAATVILLILPIMIFNAYLFLGATLRENPQA